MPTGKLIHTAKAEGCASVHHLLQKQSEVVALKQVLGSITLNVDASLNVLFSYQGCRK